MIISFYYKSFPCLHGASVYQYVNERLSLDIGFSCVKSLCPFDSCKGTHFFHTTKTFHAFFRKKNVFFFAFSV